MARRDDLEQRRKKRAAQKRKQQALLRRKLITAAAVFLGERNAQEACFCHLGSRFHVKIIFFIDFCSDGRELIFCKFSEHLLQHLMLW